MASRVAGDAHYGARSGGRRDLDNFEAWYAEKMGVNLDLSGVHILGGFDAPDPDFEFRRPPGAETPTTQSLVSNTNRGS